MYVIALRLSVFSKQDNGLSYSLCLRDETTHGFPLQTPVLPWPWPQDTPVGRVHDQHPPALVAPAAAPLTSHLPTTGWIYT